MDLTQLLCAIESRHHLRGWDSSPRTLYAVMRDPWTYDEISIQRQDLMTITAPPLAHILITEGWWREFASQADHDAEKRLYADIPGSLECRFAVAVTSQETIRICRIRERQPELVDPDSPLGSGMVASLRAIHQATLNLFPAVRSGL